MEEGDKVKGRKGSERKRGRRIGLWREKIEEGRINT